MFKTIDLALNRFVDTPGSLREHPGSEKPRSQIEVNLANLYHHYYLDAYGHVPPDPDPANFEYLRFLAGSGDFRLSGDGLGISTGARRNRSAELGQAFCRLFLHDHLDVTYFAHIEHVLNKPPVDGFGGLRLKRICAGYVPDYMCSDSQHKVYLAEAKGRYGSISFSSREFESWRTQFQRVVAEDEAKRRVSLKGFIVGTRFATEEHRSSVRSRLNAEDPATPGESVREEEGVLGLSSRIIALHYGGIAMKLRQPVLASALFGGFVVPREIQFPITVWEFISPPLQGKRFVGGYYPTAGGVAPIKVEDGRIQFISADIFRLDVGSGAFFGVEETIFEQVVLLVRKGLPAATAIKTFEEIQPFYSGISTLRDGSILSPVEFFSPIGTRVF